MPNLYAITVMSGFESYGYDYLNLFLKAQNKNILMSSHIFI